MEIIDWIIMGAFVVGAILGFSKGALRQIATLIGLVAGLLLARTLYAAVGERVAIELGTTATMAQIIAFFLIWLLVPIALLWVASVLSRVLDIVHLGFVNRLAGAVVGMVKYAILVSMALHFIEFVDTKDELIHKTVKETSLLYYPMQEAGETFIPTIKNMTKELFEKDII